MRYDPNVPCAHCGKPLGHEHADPWCSEICYKADPSVLSDNELAAMVHIADRVAAEGIAEAAQGDGPLHTCDAVSIDLTCPGCCPHGYAHSKEN